MRLLIIIVVALLSCADPEPPAEETPVESYQNPLWYSCKHWRSSCFSLAKVAEVYKGVWQTSVGNAKVIDCDDLSQCDGWRVTKTGYYRLSVINASYSTVVLGQMSPSRRWLSALSQPDIVDVDLGFLEYGDTLAFGHVSIFYDQPYGPLCTEDYTPVDLESAEAAWMYIDPDSGTSVTLIVTYSHDCYKAYK